MIKAKDLETEGDFSVEDQDSEAAEENIEVEAEMVEMTRNEEKVRESH